MMAFSAGCGNGLDGVSIATSAVREDGTFFATGSSNATPALDDMALGWNDTGTASVTAGAVEASTSVGLVWEKAPTGGTGTGCSCAGASGRDTGWSWVAAGAGWGEGGMEAVAWAVGLAN